MVVAVAARLSVLLTGTCAAAAAAAAAASGCFCFQPLLSRVELSFDVGELGASLLALHTRKSCFRETFKTHP